jgi:hypothetical protein
VELIEIIECRFSCNWVFQRLFDKKSSLILIYFRTVQTAKYLYTEKCLRHHGGLKPEIKIEGLIKNGGQKFVIKMGR